MVHTGSKLYVKGTILGYRRGRRNTYHHTSLLKVDGVNDVESSRFYFGKKVAFIYKAKAQKAGSKFRVVWGKVTTAHGSNGVVRAKFSSNLDPKTIGSSVRVMLYPSSI
jgi:large subunit ribosomal protein L35Ae